MATADQADRWRRYVILHHLLPPHQCLPAPTSPREPPSPAGGEGACDANSEPAGTSPRPLVPDRSQNPERSRNPARGSHYDLMFETTDGLLTWAVEHMPAVGQPPQPALRLPLHRAVYLDYEGPVSGDRGRVIRVQAGTYRPASLGQCAAAGLSQHDLVQYDTTQQAAVANDSATDKHLAFVCRGCDADGRTVAQLVLLDRVEECDWELRSIIAPPR